MQRTAIVAVHGVIPHPKHGFQDEVATALRHQLNELAHATAPSAPSPKANATTPPHSQRGPGQDGGGTPRGTEDEVWAMDVVFPAIPAGPAGPDPVGAARSSIVRIHRASEPDAMRPRSDYYDVIEAYWSPLDKGRTNAASVLAWLLTTVFRPLNTTAHYEAAGAKKCSDVLSVLAFVVLGLLAFVVCLIAFGNSLAITLAHATKNVPANAGGGLWTGIGDTFRLDLPLLWNSLSLLWSSSLDDLRKLFSADVLVRLGLGAVGAFLVVQAGRAGVSICRQHTALAAMRVQLRSRWIAVALLGAVALVCFGLCGLWPFAGGRQLGTAALWLVFSAFAFEVGKASATTFLTDFFGDVQIYCTRDENAAFFEYRGKILDLVTRTLVETVKAQPRYDRVYIFAHSLGSTISLDALMRMYDLRAENGVEPEQFQRIRGFVTFGTSLEKTRFFLDSYTRSLSATFEEWRGDYYGSLFDSRRAVLSEPNGPATGIYWANYWYFSDFIADRISTYRSFVPPGGSVSTSSAIRREIRNAVHDGEGALGPLVAQNRVSYRVPSLGTPILHSEYLTSDWFWKEPPAAEPSWLARLLGPRAKLDENDAAVGALDIVTSRAPVPSPTPPQAAAHAAAVSKAAAVADDAAAVTDSEAAADVEPAPVTPRGYTVLTSAEARSSPVSDILMP